jgi:hypothetical protein
MPEEFFLHDTIAIIKNVTNKKFASIFFIRKVLWFIKKITSYFIYCEILGAKNSPFVIETVLPEYKSVR